MTEDAESYRPVILVVDDEPVIADTLAEILKRTGYTANAAYDGESAIQAALNAPPQLVISDIMMPGLNGIELCMAIRKIFPDCKAILSSGRSDSSRLLAAAFSAGNHFVFLPKPVHPKVLLKHVAECLGRS